MDTGEDRRAEIIRRGLSDALPEARRLADQIQRLWPLVESQLPRSAIEGALAGLEDDLDEVIELSRTEHPEDVFQGFFTMFVGAFCVGYRAHEAAKGDAPPTPRLTDEERDSAFHVIIESVFRPTYTREMEAFLLVAAVALRQANDAVAREGIIDVFKAGFCLGCEAYNRHNRRRRSPK